MDAKLQQQFIKKIEHTFHRIDNDKNGSISFSELRFFLDRNSHRIIDRDLSSEIKGFQMFDRDASGEIDLKEFVEEVKDFFDRPHTVEYQFIEHIFETSGDSLASFRKLRPPVKKGAAKRRLTGIGTGLVSSQLKAFQVRTLILTTAHAIC